MPSLSEITRSRRPSSLRHLASSIGISLIVSPIIGIALPSITWADVIGQVVLRDYRGATATPNGAQNTKELHYQDQVSALDTVKTGDNGATSMQFLDQTRFDVGPNAMVTLDDFIFDPVSSETAGRISMTVGAFRYVGGKMKSDENVKLVTPTATMSIRGTELVIYVGIDGTTEVNVVSGAVDVTPCDKDDALAVTAGQRVIIPITCTANVSSIRELPENFAALEVPSNLSEFATAAGTESEGNSARNGSKSGMSGQDRNNDKDRNRSGDKSSSNSEPDPDIDK